jgi:hypothetical protein
MKSVTAMSLKFGEVYVLRRPSSANPEPRYRYRWLRPSRTLINIFGCSFRKGQRRAIPLGEKVPMALAYNDVSIPRRHGDTRRQLTMVIIIITALFHIEWLQPRGRCNDLNRLVRAGCRRGCLRCLCISMVSRKHCHRRCEGPTGQAEHER